MKTKTLLERLQRLSADDLELPVLIAHYGICDPYMSKVVRVSICRTEEQREELHDKPFVLLHDVDL